jgi:hypothetical protein
VSRRAPPLEAPERELLLDCARLDGEEARLESAAQLVRGGLDWDSLCVHALLHSVAPLVHLRLRELPEYERIPAAARQRLLGLWHRAGYQNRHLAAEHRDLAEALRSEGIELMVPKGLSLVELVYGGHERRPLIDLVYIVPPGDLSAATAALVRRGYEGRGGHPAHAAWRWLHPAATLVIEREVSVMVMFLTSLVSRPRMHSFDLAAVWSRADRVGIAGAEALMPSPEDLVIYLCGQADAHGYLNRAAAGAVDPVELMFSEWANNRLVRFVDIRETARHHGERIDWELLASRAERSGLGETVRVGLELTEAMLGPTVPERALDGLGPSGRHRMHLWLLDAVRSQTAGVEAGPARRRVGSWWLGLGPRRQSRLAPLLGLLEYAFCDPGSLRRRHPRWPRAALWLSYPFRAGWVLIRSAVALTTRLAGGAARSSRPGPVGHRLGSSGTVIR